MGSDGFPEWLAAPVFAHPVAYLFNLSLQHSVVPQ